MTQYVFVGSKERDSRGIAEVAVSCGDMSQPSFSCRGVVALKLFVEAARCRKTLDSSESRF